MGSMQRIRWWARGALAALLLGLAAAALPGLSDADGLGHDESIALLSMTGHQLDRGPLDAGKIQPLSILHQQVQLDPSRGIADLFYGLRATDFHPPLYFVLGRLWLQAGGLVGVSTYPPATAVPIDVWLTRLSGLLLVLAVAVLVVAGLRRQDAVGLAHLAAAASIPHLPYLASHGFNCRPYALVALLAVVGWVLLLERLRFTEGTGSLSEAATRAAILRLDLALGLVLGLGLLTHYLFLFYALGILIPFLGMGRRGLASAVRAGLVTVALFGPWLLFAGERVLKPPAHLRKVTPSAEIAIERLDRLLRDYLSLGDSLPELSHWVLPGALALGLLLLLCHNSRVSRALAAVLALPFLGPLCVDLAVGRSLLAVDRVAVAAVPIGLWAIGWALANLPARLAPFVVAAAAILVVSAAPEHSFRANRYIQGGDVASAILERADVASMLVVTTADARGQLLRRTRYLPSSADLAFVPARDLAKTLPTLAAPYTHLYVLGVPRPYGGRQKFRRKHAETYDKALRARGWTRTRSKRRHKNGWALYSKSR